MKFNLKKKASRLPSIIRTLNGFGAELYDAGDQWKGDCPFCGKEGHFFCDAGKQVWDCKVCGEAGNQYTVLEKWVAVQEPCADFSPLAEAKDLDESTLARLGCGYSEGVGFFFPIKNAAGKIRDIRRWKENSGNVMSQAGCQAQLWGADVLRTAPTGSAVWLCEGEWDRVALEWVIEKTKNGSFSVAVPGAGTFKNEWVESLRGMHVVIAYDNDPAGHGGAARALKKLREVAASVRFLSWPAALPKGFDLRDFINGAKGRGASYVWSALKSHVKASIGGTVVASDDEGGVEELTPITYWELLEEFEERVLMTPDLDLALRVSLAVAISGAHPGDPLWTYIVGPPGGGKTMVVSTLAGSDKVVFRSKIGPHELVSGWAGKGDPSLIPRLKNKTLIAKDFTEVLCMPQTQQEEIFGVLRGAFDGCVHQAYGNGVVREYIDCRFGLVAAVTHAVHGHKMASLGERFLKFELHDLTQEDADAVIGAAMANVGKEREIEDGLQLAVSRFLSRKCEYESLPTMPRKYLDRLSALVQIIGGLRANVDRDKYTDEISFRPKSESGTRLGKQLVKLARCLAFVLDRDIDDEIYRIVERVAFDTAGGFNLEIARAVMDCGERPSFKEISRRSKIPDATLRRRIADLEILGVIVKGREEGGKAGRPSNCWSVTNKFLQLWRRAHPPEAEAPKRARLRRVTQ